MEDVSVAVVIPAYKCRQQILKVIAGIGPEVRSIYVVDDQCPEHTGDFVQSQCHDSRVQVLRHQLNGGVGAAVITGFRKAKAEHATVIVKVDGDGQMDPSLIPRFVAPIVMGHADYTKGNRFYNIEDVRQMPLARLLGNAALSFISKLSSGYWDIFDPTNGYVAIHCAALDSLPLDKVAERYFFESDMLFRLNLARAVVLDISMPSVYGDEVSGLRISRILHDFATRHLVNFGKRVFYNYFLRNFSVASVELVVGGLGFAFGCVFGARAWYHSYATNVLTPVGTVMLAVLPILIGVQFLLNFLNFDIASVPRRPLSLGSSYNVHS